MLRSESPSSAGSLSSSSGSRCRSVSPTRYNPYESSRDEELAAEEVFYNVRKGGPKEKRIRKVATVGEFSPKPLYWVKIEKSNSSDGPLCLSAIRRECEMRSVNGINPFLKIYLIKPLRRTNTTESAMLVILISQWM